MATAPRGRAQTEGRTAAAILEELAVVVMSTDPSDEAGVARMIALLEELVGLGDAAVSASAAQTVQRIRADAADVRALGKALDAASEDVARMQEALARGGPAAPAPAPAASPDAFVLPEWSDEKVLKDFLAAQRVTLEDLEREILSMEGGGAEGRAAFKRRLHTIKGEAGVLGLDDLESVCHATEDYLEANGVSADLTDRLLKVRDWMVKAADAYAVMRRPSPSARDLIDGVLRLPAEGAAQPGPGSDAAASGPASPEPSAPAAPSAAGAPSGGVEKVQRDAETVSLFGEFLSESAEGLNRVEGILINVERAGIDGDSVNSLFRVFHTVKGTAGFLELEEIVSLAHDTETMLNLCREGALELKGEVIDVVFDATSALREMLESVRIAIEQGTTFPRRPGIDELLRRIERASEHQGAAAAEAPAAAPAPAAPQPAQGVGAAPAEPVPAPSAPVHAAPVHAPAQGQTPAQPPTQPAAKAPTPAAAETAAAEEAGQGGAAQRPPARPAGAEGEGGAKLKDTIKVDLERVDSLVEMIGELVVVESMVVNAPEISKTSSVRVRNCLAQLAKVTRDLQDVGMRMRMVPVAGVFQKMARLVRDLSRKSGKAVRLVTSGEATEMDRSMVEQIADPLVHMIRNACDHGLESAEGRAAAGKPTVGTVRLSAYHEGGSVVIEITDDGRGLDKNAIVKKAMEKGLISSADGMTEAEIHGLIFAPGFSTAAKITEISGRGVGMDVVKRNIDAMRGRVVITSTPGAGTRFKLVLPLTLAIIDGMLVACGAERYIIPTLSIVESIQPDRKMLVSLAERNEMINLRGEILPLMRLDRLFGLEGAKVDPTEALVVVVEGVGRRLGLLVDEVVTQQQVVIKSLGEGMGRARFMSGAAILSDGRVGLILNVEEIAMLVRKSHDFFHERAEAPAVLPATLQEARA